MKFCPFTLVSKVSKYIIIIVIFTLMHNSRLVNILVMMNISYGSSETIYILVLSLCSIYNDRVRYSIF